MADVGDRTKDQIAGTAKKVRRDIEYLRSILRGLETTQKTMDHAACVLNESSELLAKLKDLSTKD